GYDFVLVEERGSMYRGPEKTFDDWYRGPIDKSSTTTASEPTSSQQAPVPSPRSTTESRITGDSTRPSCRHGRPHTAGTTSSSTMATLTPRFPVDRIPGRCRSRRKATRLQTLRGI